VSCDNSPRPGPDSLLEELLASGADLIAKGEADAAVELLRKAVALYPANARSLMGLGMARKAAGHVETALPFLTRAVDLEPDWLEARYNLGYALLAAGRLCEAEESLRRVIAARPEWAYAQNSLGTALLRQGRFVEAAEAFHCAIASACDWYLPLYNLGLALTQLGDDQAAIIALRSAMQLQPDVADTHWNLSFLLLKHGQFDEGFKEYEWRFRNAGLPAPRAGRLQPLWDGRNLEGATLLLCAEQGAGDLIQFIRFAQRAAVGGMKILVECPASLQRLFASCAVEEPCAAAGLQLPLLSLPRVLGLQPEDLPGPIPYLAAPAGERGIFDALAGVDHGLRVGIAWTGDPRNAKNFERSVTPNDFAPLALVPGVEIFSLQYQNAGVPARQLEQMRIRSLGDAFGDFASAAAAIDHLDLTITVDTATAHLAGALAKPVWTLLDHRPDWRWMIHPSASPWYPTMRLYRQDQAGDWSQVLARVERDLVDLVKL
jgi:tetratricopeptide (TPR) repeat protein